MRELHVVALSEDGRHVVLATRAGAGSGDFRVALDERLTAAVRGELPAPGRDAPPSISPRDIQARLRDGETPDEIAASAGVPLSRVERYAGPVLAELERMVTGARASVVSRPRLGPSSVPLGEAVEAHLAEVAHLADGSVRWAARRTELGRWVVEVHWTARGRRRTAGWHYDPATREVVAADGPSAVLGHVEAGDPVANAGARAVRPAAPAAGVSSDGRTGRTGGAGTGRAARSAATAATAATATSAVPSASRTVTAGPGALPQRARPSATASKTGRSDPRATAPAAKPVQRGTGSGEGRRPQPAPARASGAAAPGTTPARAPGPTPGTAPARATTPRATTPRATTPRATTPATATPAPAARRRAAALPDAPAPSSTPARTSAGRAPTRRAPAPAAQAAATSGAGRASSRRTAPRRSAVPSLEALAGAPADSGATPAPSQPPTPAPPQAPTAAPPRAPTRPPAASPPGPPVLRVVPPAEPEPDRREEADAVPPPEARPARRAAGQRAGGRDWADVLMGGAQAPPAADPRQD